MPHGGACLTSNLPQLLERLHAHLRSTVLSGKKLPQKWGGAWWLTCAILSPVDKGTRSAASARVAHFA